MYSTKSSGSDRGIRAQLRRSRRQRNYGLVTTVFPCLDARRQGDGRRLEAHSAAHLREGRIPS